MTIQVAIIASSSRLRSFEVEDADCASNTMENIVGEIPGVSVGDHFDSRDSLSASGVHRPNRGGIGGAKQPGAVSIVLSGGYADDEDYGHTVIYTGAGGQRKNTKEQIEDQSLDLGNKLLALSKDHGIPIRVVRGSGHKSIHSPKEGYRYDGLYQITDYWHEIGNHGYLVWRYRLEQDVQATGPAEDADPVSTERRATTTLRIVRDTAVSRQLKEDYGYACQVCGLAIETKSGFYAEAAHIRPLGKPHNGPDVRSNLLCLCPNHHVMLDAGMFSIEDSYSLIGLDGTLTVKGEHGIDADMLAYHREKYS